jgi:hypothetical protein
MLTWNRKAKGNTACMESESLREGVNAELSQDSHTTVKAELLARPIASRANGRPTDTTPDIGALLYS